MGEGGKGDKRKGGDTETIGRRAEGKGGGNTLARGGGCTKRPQTEKRDAETEAGGEA